jgi:acyl-coenzyme A synthetase/AMP-(fatty) acid ligase
MTSISSAITIAQSLALAIERGGESVAVVSPDEHLSFAQLGRSVQGTSEKINAQLGDSPGVVAIVSPNRNDALIACLGVMCAGKTVAILDPSHPDARLHTMLESCTPQLILCPDSLLERAKTWASQLSHQCHVRAFTALSPPSAGDLKVPNICANAPAIIVFTSGSTGGPKGIVETHAGALSRYRLLAQAIDLTRHDCVATIAHFSGCRIETIGPLLHGASVCLFDLSGRGFAELETWMKACHVSALRLLPTTARALARANSEFTGFAQLRAVHFIGEGLRGGDLRRIRSQCDPNTRIFNLYASNESGPCTALEATKLDFVDSQPVPIGSALPGCQLRIVNPNGDECEPGATGRIVVRSPGVFTQYCDDVEGTRKALRVHNEATWLHTDDLGECDAQGNITLTGRAGLLVKVAGHRINLAEVEQCLNEVDVVDECAVVIWERRPGESVLLAFVKIHTGKQFDAHLVRAQMSASLPLYMLPARFVPLATAPLTANGKRQTRSNSPALASTR